MMPMKLTARKSSQVAVSWSNISPALFTRQSTCPKLSTTVRPIAAICSASVTSASSTSAWRPMPLMSSATGPAWSMRFRSMIADVGALRRHGPRVRGADPLRRTGHDAHLVLQPIPHVLPSPPRGRAPARP